MDNKHKTIVSLLVAILALSLVNTYGTLIVLKDKVMISQDQNGNQGNTQDNSQPIGQNFVPATVDDDAAKGSDSAPVTIIEFSDFQCPFCEKFFRETLPQIEAKYIQTGKVKLVYRDFPLDGHQFAQKASEAAECAKDQGKFWEYHNKLFQNQNALEVNSLKQYALALGLNAPQFNQCLDSGSKTAEVQKDYQDGIASGVNGTPGFFINGKLIVGALPYSVFQQEIESALAAQ